MSEKTFGKLGLSFQQALIKAIIEDRKYGEIIIDVIESTYFDNNSFRYIMENIKELYVTYEKISDYETLKQKITSDSGSADSARIHLDTLTGIKENNQDIQWVKDEALNFCKQQNLKKEIKKIQNIIDNGAFQEYKNIEEIIQKALQVGIANEDAKDVFQDIENSLEADFRHPIPTGILGIDNLLDGGLGRGELGVVLAPTGIGKSTLITKIANTAFNAGFHVFQIFFEDNPDVIKRKHYTIWTGIAPDELPLRKDEAIPLIKEAENRSTGSLRLLRLPSDSVTISEIKSKLRKHKADGNKIDLVLIDYVDCISPERSTFGEEWKGEGSIMRSLEAMTTEFDIALWTATQGNRDSISSEVVTADQMGGSIKKAQIGHVIISVGKTLEQKEHNLGTLTLVKSRIGQDGVVFQNCTFNNKMLIIDTESQNTLLGIEENKIEDRKNRAADMFKKRQEMLNRIDKSLDKKA